MIYLDGDLYITGQDFRDPYGTTIDELHSRGFVLKYNPSDETCKYFGTSSEKVERTSLNNVKMAVYKDSSAVFKDSARSQPLIITGGLEVSVLEFPTIFTPAPLSKKLSTSCLYGASKIIAIKPKKLVISEEGVAFYTENDQLFYKNVNRIVTVNLDDFAFKFDNTDSPFFEDYDTVYRGSITANDAFWSSTVGIGTTLYPGINGTEFEAGLEDVAYTYYIAIPLKQN